MVTAQKIFAANLREACSTRASISQVCREIGVNRQQYNRYINGQALPSAHNRLRIARAFADEPEDLDLPREEVGQHLGPCVNLGGRGDARLDGYPAALKDVPRYVAFEQS